MAFSLEDLWKDASDEDVVAAIGKWESTNESAQRALIAEVKRRGLKIAVPEVTAAPAQTSSAAPSPLTGKVLLLVVGILVIMGVLATLIS